MVKILKNLFITGSESYIGFPSPNFFLPASLKKLYFEYYQSGSGAQRRKIFQDWPRYGSIKKGFSFQAPSNWQISVDELSHTYTIVAEDRQTVLEIVTIDNADEKDFETYVVGEFLKEYPPDQARYQMNHIDLDLDYPHNIYYQKTNPDEFYILSGNNEMFYKLTINNTKKAALLIRTLEFNVTIDEDISL